MEFFLFGLFLAFIASMVALVIIVVFMRFLNGIMSYYDLKQEKTERLYFIYKLRELIDFISVAKTYPDFSFNNIQYKQEIPVKDGESRVYQVKCRPKRLFLEFFFHKYNNGYDTIIGIPKNIFVFFGGIAFISLRYRKEKNTIKKANRID